MRQKKYKNINIAYLVQRLDFGGLERLVVEMAKRVNREIFVPSVCCLLTPGPRELSGELAERQIKVTYMNKPSGVDYSFIFRLARYFQKERIDLVHTQCSTTNLYGGIAARIAGIRHIFNTEHGGIYFETRRKQMVNRLLPLLNKKMVCVSEKVREDLIGMGLPEAKLAVIPNGIDFSNFSGNIDRDAKRKGLGLSRRDFIIGTVGRLEKVKNQRMLIESAKDIRTRIPEAKFVIIGEGSLRSELEEYAGSLGMVDNVVFLGYRSDIPSIVSIFDCFVNCSVSEAFGLTVIEAMMAGVPVVATDVGGVKEIIKDNVTGILIANNDNSALIKAILKIKDDPLFTKQMIAEARRYVESRYSIERMVGDYETLYLEALKNRV